MQPHPNALCRGPRHARGFTLVEVMMAAIVLSFAAVGIFATLNKAYEFSALSRYRDDARGVLRAYADQFQRMASSDKNPASGQTLPRALFSSVDPVDAVHQVGVGTGLAPLNSLSGVLANAGLAGSDPMPIWLGAVQDDTHPNNHIVAYLTRIVQPVVFDPAGGTTNGTTISAIVTPPRYVAGQLLLGTFTIKYQLISNGPWYYQTLTVLRNAPG